MRPYVILAYHRILPPQVARQRGVLAVTTVEFENQIQWFLRKGWECLTLSQSFTRYFSLGKEPRKTFVLTFDDGYQDNYLHAYPILEKYHLPATVFLVTDYLANGRDLYFYDHTKPYVPIPEDYALLPKQINEMQSGGIEFGSHTVTHPKLATVSQDAALREVQDSKAALETVLGQKVTSLCYPYGSVNASVVNAAARSGYLVGVVTTHGPGIPRSVLTLRRTGVYRGDSLAKVQLKCSRSFYALRETPAWEFLK